MIPGDSKDNGYINFLRSKLYFPLFTILTLIAVVSSLQAYFLFFKGIHSLTNYSLHLLSKIVYSWYFIFTAIIVEQLSKKLRLTKKTILRLILIHLLVLILVALLHTAVSYTTDKLLFGQYFKETFRGILFNYPSLYVDFIVYILFLLGFYLNEYKKRNKENELRLIQLEEQIIKSKLHELRSKIHPDFLFNTLKTIDCLIMEDRNKDANNVLSSLSEFLRVTVYNSEQETVLLSHEIEFLMKYLEIEKECFENRFNIYEEIETSTLEALIPNFILQPVAEEVLYKTLFPLHEQFNVTIGSKKDGDTLSIEMKFALKSYKQIEFNEVDSTSFQITQERLEKLFLDKQKLKIENSTVGLIKIIFQIPFIAKEQ